jgi:magnesium-transporting ATPase (P-type)
MTFTNREVFAKFTLIRKVQILDSLKARGEVVGVLGDGINGCCWLKIC